MRELTCSYCGNPEVVFIGPCAHHAEVAICQKCSDLGLLETCPDCLYAIRNSVSNYYKLGTAETTDLPDHVERRSNGCRWTTHSEGAFALLGQGYSKGGCVAPTPGQPGAQLYPQNQTE